MSSGCMDRESASWKIWLIGGLVIAVLLSGCIVPWQQARQTDQQPAAGPLPLIGTTWILKGYKGSYGLMVPIYPNFKARVDYVTARFDDGGNLGGFAGCNHYGASYTLIGQNGISISLLSTTLVACQSPEGKQEGAYLSLLRSVSSYETTADGMLNLKDAHGKLILVYSGR